jgi:hypothetical protein
MKGVTAILRPAMHRGLEAVALHGLPQHRFLEPRRLSALRYGRIYHIPSQHPAHCLASSPAAGLSQIAGSGRSRAVTSGSARYTAMIGPVP